MITSSHSKGRKNVIKFAKMAEKSELKGVFQTQFDEKHRQIVIFVTKRMFLCPDRTIPTLATERAAIHA